MFLDKPFVPKILMPRQKTEWYHKFATKALFQHPRHNTSFILESLKNTNVGTEHVDKQDNCSSVTEQITDLEIFEMEESISQVSKGACACICVCVCVGVCAHACVCST